MKKIGILGTGNIGTDLLIKLISKNKKLIRLNEQIKEITQKLFTRR
jgi:acetaldehyde dehydrogenase (acetylating)